jgi:alkylhydroperoxidase family enzyme
MSWIRTISEREATGDLAELYRVWRSPEGPVDNILKISSLNLPLLQAHIAIYKQCMRGKSGLSRAQREMIAVVVSAANRCRY